MGNKHDVFFQRGAAENKIPKVKQNGKSEVRELMRDLNSKSLIESARITPTKKRRRLEKDYHYILLPIL